MSIYWTIKKYLLILSVFFSILISIHLIFIYFYGGSKLLPEEWGTINIGFMADLPSLNPALYGLNSTNDYILRFLSRSLLRYNIETKQMEWDIANCNLGKDFSEIKCYVKNDNKWSDGTVITNEDILATYQLLKETDINKPIKKILANITIQDQGDFIQFSWKADVLMLDIFLYPIIRKDIVEKIKNDTFNLNSLISSGPYIFEKREQDEKINIDKISLIKNPYFTHEKIYIDRYVYKFFHDTDTLISNKDALNIIYPTNKIESIPSVRFQKYNYLLPEYITLFLNKEKLETPLRTIILSQIGNTSYKNLDEKKWKIIKNPFFWEESIIPKIMKQEEVDGIMKELGYYKKDILIKELTKNIDEKKVQIPVSNSYFITPTNKKYFVTKESNILLSGSVPTGVTGVFINDYRLKSFTPWSKNFYFRANTELGNLKNGTNSYTLSFEQAGKKIIKESITLYYALTQENFDTIGKEYATKNISVASHNLSLEKGKNQAKKTLETQIASLDPLYYYNKNLKKMSINLSYIHQSDTFDFMKIAEEMKSTLNLIGIDMTLQELSTDDIQNIVNKGEKKYDMILTGISLGLFEYNVFPFFHSGQAEKGFNFAKIKNIPMDILLEQLKSSQMNSESLKHIETGVLEILKKEQVVFTLYSPYNSFFIDNNLKQIKTVTIIPSSSFIYDIGGGVYIKEDRIIDFTKKSITDFISWIRLNYPKNLSF